MFSGGTYADCELEQQWLKGATGAPCVYGMCMQSRKKDTTAHPFAAIFFQHYLSGYQGSETWSSPPVYAEMSADQGRSSHRR